MKDFAARLAGSGIAAGAIASRFIARLCGYENSIGFDMGGTSTDISLVYEGIRGLQKIGMLSMVTQFVFQASRF